MRRCLALIHTIDTIKRLNSPNENDGIWIGLNLVNFNGSKKTWIWNDDTQLDSENVAWNPGKYVR